MVLQTKLITKYHHLRLEDTMANFNDLLKDKDLLAFIEDQGIKAPTPVQVKGIPLLAKRESISLLGKTGTEFFGL